MSAAEDNDGYSIGAVARMTNLSVHTLRAWERRYGAVEVQRSPAGQRRYSTHALRRLMLIKRLVDQGEPISLVAELDDDSLSARFETIAATGAERLAHDAPRQRVAVVGETLPARLKGAVGGARVVLAEANPARLLAGLAQARPDAVIVETDFVGPGTFELLAAVRRHSASSRVLVVYGFARHVDAQRLVDAGAIVLRAPVTTSSIAALLGPPPSAVPANGHRGEQPSRDAEPALLPAPRRFTGAQLASLAQASTTVECECPTHLVDLVHNLLAFESYSADCESRNADDAALHAWLHRTTAAARALVEEALDEVARVEGIALDE